jgi:hypothetical protein
MFAVLGAAGLFRLAPRPLATAVVVATALLMHLSWYGRFPGGPALLDGRTAYMDFVDAHVRASRWIEANAPGARVAATWPVLDELHEPFFGYVSRPVETVALDALPEGPEALDRFDVLYEAPVPQNPNPARDLALRLGLVEAARFDVNGQSVILWTPALAPHTVATAPGSVSVQCANLPERRLKRSDRRTHLAHPRPRRRSGILDR